MTAVKLLPLPEPLLFIHRDTLAEMLAADYAMDGVVSTAKLDGPFAGVFTADQFRAALAPVVARAEKAEAELAGLREIARTLVESHEIDDGMAAGMMLACAVEMAKSAIAKEPTQ